MNEESEEPETLVPFHLRRALSTKLIHVTTPSYPTMPGTNGPFLLEDLGDYVSLIAPLCSLHHDRAIKKDVDEDWPLHQWFGSDRTVQEVPLRLLRGEFHPRIWRNGIEAGGHLRAADIDDARPRAIAFHRIQAQLRGLFEVVTPRRSNAAAHGPAIEQALTLCAREVEALLRNVYDANRGTRSSEHSMSDWAALLGPMKLDRWEAQLSYFPEWEWARPFRGWTADCAPSWWTANNKFKHEDGRRWMANLESVISAACAIRILLEAMFGPGIADLLPTTDLADIVITDSPTWAADEVYFPGLGDEPRREIPAL